MLPFDAQQRKPLNPAMLLQMIAGASKQSPDAQEQDEQEQPADAAELSAYVNRNRQGARPMPQNPDDIAATAQPVNASATAVAGSLPQKLSHTAGGSPSTGASVPPGIAPGGDGTATGPVAGPRNPAASVLRAQGATAPPPGIPAMAGPAMAGTTPRNSTDLLSMPQLPAVPNYPAAPQMTPMPGGIRGRLVAGLSGIAGIQNPDEIRRRQQFQDALESWQAQVAPMREQYQEQLQRAQVPINVLSKLQQLYMPRGGMYTYHFDPTSGKTIRENKFTGEVEPVELPGIGPKAGLDKRLNSYTNAAGQNVDVMQRPDNSIYERTGGQVRETRDPSQAAQGRSDKSYQYNAGRIDKLRTPVEARMQRVSNILDSLNANSPQADALIAPELLTVMAGGQGSGLRMNEAEIARIVGGRTNWESLKAAVGKWQLDPSKPFALTPDQRQQVRALVSAVHSRLQQKMAAFDEADDSLLNTDDVKQHRAIVNRLHKKLGDIDLAGDNQTAGPKTYTHSFLMQEAAKRNISPQELERRFQAAGWQPQE